MPRRAQDDGHPLPHVEHRHLQCTRLQGRALRCEQRQQEEQAEPAAGQAAGCDQQGGADQQPEPGGGCQGCAGPGHRGHIGHPFQGRAGEFDGEGRQFEQRGGRFPQQGEGERRTEGQGDQEEGENRHGDQVDQGRRQGNVELKGQQNRRQADEEAPLDAADAPPGRRLAAPGDGQQNDRDRAEGEPQAGGEHRVRIVKHDQGKGDRQRVEGAQRPPEKTPSHDDRQHQQGALGGQGEPGQRRVPGGRGKGGNGAGRVRRKARQQPRDEACQASSRKEGDAGDDADVQSRNRDQVAGAGAPKDAPGGVVEAAAVADGERDQHRAAAASADPLDQAVPNRLPKPPQARPSAPVDPRVGSRPPHVAGGRYARAMEPTLVVEAVRVDQAPGSPQPGGEAPPFARPQCRGIPVPGQADQAGGAVRGPRPADALHLEQKAGSSRIDFGKARDHPLEHQVVAFEFRVQRERRGEVGMEQGPQKTERGSAEKPECGHANPAERHRRQQRPPEGARQGRRLLKKQDAGD